MLKRQSDVESVAPGRYTGCRMERVRLTPPGEKRARGGRARLYVRWMPHLGAEAVALYELLRILPDLDVEVIRAEPDGVSADDYFRFMGTLPAPHILEFLNGYCGRDGLTPDAVREALKIASERDARRVGYVRSILERWVERGVKTVEDVERFEQDRKLRLVEQSG